MTGAVNKAVIGIGKKKSSVEITALRRSPRLNQEEAKTTIVVRRGKNKLKSETKAILRNPRPNQEEPGNAVRRSKRLANKNKSNN